MAPEPSRSDEAGDCSQRTLRQATGSAVPSAGCAEEMPSTSVQPNAHRLHRSAPFAGGKPFSRALPACEVDFDGARSRPSERRAKRGQYFLMLSSVNIAGICVPVMAADI